MGFNPTLILYCLYCFLVIGEIHWTGEYVMEV